MRKLFLFAAATLLCLPPAFAQDVYVRIGPPPPVVERPGPRPHPGFVWVQGYHRWDGVRYVWVPGHWVRPPRPGWEWIPGHWRHERGGWYWIDGHWRRR